MPPPAPPAFGRSVTSDQEIKDEVFETESLALKNLLQFDDTQFGAKISVTSKFSDVVTLAHSLLVLSGKLELRVKETEMMGKLVLGKTHNLHLNVNLLKSLGKKLCKVIRVEVQMQAIRAMSAVCQSDELYSSTYSEAALPCVVDLCQTLIAASDSLSTFGGSAMERYALSGLDLLLGHLFLRSFKYAKKKITHVGADAVLSSVKEAGAALRSLGCDGLEEEAKAVEKFRDVSGEFEKGELRLTTVEAKWLADNKKMADDGGDEVK